MNGWNRRGTVLSITWCILVAGYAGYERSQLPVRVFGVEDNNPGNGFNIARGLLFVDLDSTSEGNSGATMKLLEDAKTDGERKAAALKITTANSFVLETSLNGAFCALLAHTTLRVMGPSLRHLFCFQIRTCWIQKLTTFTSIRQSGPMLVA